MPPFPFSELTASGHLVHCSPRRQDAVRSAVLTFPLAVAQQCRPALQSRSGSYRSAPHLHCSKEICFSGSIFGTSVLVGDPSFKLKASPFPCMLVVQAASRGFALLSRLGTSRESARLQRLGANAHTHGARHSSTSIKSCSTALKSSAQRIRGEWGRSWGSRTACIHAAPSSADFLFYFLYKLLISTRIRLYLCRSVSCLGQQEHAGLLIGLYHYWGPTVGAGLSCPPAN